MTCIKCFSFWEKIASITDGCYAFSQIFSAKKTAAVTKAATTKNGNRNEGKKEMVVGTQKGLVHSRTVFQVFARLSKYVCDHNVCWCVVVQKSRISDWRSLIVMKDQISIKLWNRSVSESGNSRLSRDLACKVPRWDKRSSLLPSARDTTHTARRDACACHGTTADGQSMTLISLRHTAVYS